MATGNYISMKKEMYKSNMPTKNHQLKQLNIIMLDILLKNRNTNPNKVVGR